LTRPRSEHHCPSMNQIAEPELAEIGRNAAGKNSAMN
jgi:hypothetical protein